MGIKTTCRAGGPFNYQFLHLEYEGDERTLPFALLTITKTGAKGYLLSSSL